MTSKPVLRVTMLGSFELRYNLEPVQLKKRQSSKPVQLLQLLLHNRGNGVSRQRVIEALYGLETGIDTANNLNATASQLRRLLRDTILPKENYICMDVDRYSFQSSFPVQVDTEEVLSLQQQAAMAEGNDRIELLHKLCTLYQGRFLPELDGESWVEAARGYYEMIYRNSMEELCRMLRERQEYLTILRLTEYAAKIFPFDEWQAWHYESLLALGRIQEAQKLYQETEKLYLSELDAPPPERMRQRLRTPVNAAGWEARNVRAIRKQLDETERAGPYCLPLPSFLDAYHLICRMSGAAGQPVTLMLCTLRGGDSRSRQARETFRTAMEQLEAALCQTLRQEDTFTRYSRSQYLSVLIGVEDTNCGAVSRRVSEQFSGLNVGQRFALECQTVPLKTAEILGRV